MRAESMLYIANRRTAGSEVPATADVPGNDEQRDDGALYGLVNCVFELLCAAFVATEMDVV